VLARSAVFRHKGSAEDPITIGRALGIRAVVTGRVRQRGSTLLISAELIDIESGWQLWGAQYRRSAEDIYEIEDEIAKEISQKLRLKLSPERKKVLDKRRTDNNEAYHLYLKGRFHWGKRTEESLYKVLQEARVLSSGNTLVTATLAAALPASGKESETNAILVELEEIGRSRYVPQTAVAAAYACRRDDDQALSCLEKACEDHCLHLPYALTADARFDALRGEARFQSLKQRVARSVA
jgi:hypothetical protein